MNMAYCRFRNTLEDLQACYDALFDDDLSQEEARARRHLIKLCHDIAQDTEDEYEDMLEQARQRVKQ